MYVESRADGNPPNGSGDAIRGSFEGPYIDPECAAELNAALDACFNAMTGPDLRERLLEAAALVRDWPTCVGWLRECGDTRAHELADRTYGMASSLLTAAALQLDWNATELGLVLEAARADAWRPRLPGELPLSCRTAAALAMDLAFQAVAKAEGGNGKPVESEPRDATPEQAPKRAKRRGRKPDTNPKEDKRIFDVWQTGQYQTYADLDNALHLPNGEGKRACDRHRKRLPKGK